MIATSDSPSQARDEAIRRIIAEVKDRRLEDSDILAITSQHAHLMPELGQMLNSVKIFNGVLDARREPNDAAEGDLSMEDLLDEELTEIRDFFPNYELRRPLRYGGQGTVYQAVDRRTGRKVAIKILNDGPLATRAQRNRFKREIEIIAQLKHPNIVTLYETGVVRGRQYFAMEYIEGLPIDGYARLHCPRLADCLLLTVKVCRAIAGAHQKGIIHRDLKPENIIVDLEGEPHVLDFGFSKDTAATNDSMSMSGQIVGTLPYVSPERILDAEQHLHDVRSDIFSIGVILFQILTGEMPYPVEPDPFKHRDRVLRDEPRDLLSVCRGAGDWVGHYREEIDVDVGRIVAKALAKDPPRRYQTAFELAEDLERYVRNEPIQAREQSRLYLLKKTVYRHRAAFTFAACLVLMLLISSAVSTSFWFEAARQRDNTRQMARQFYESSRNLLDNLDAFSSLAGGTAPTNRLLADYKRDIDRLLPLIADDEQMRDVLADMRERQADLAVIEGRRTDAAAAYQASLDIRQAMRYEASDDPRIALAIARSHRKLARTADDPSIQFERAIALSEELTRSRPDDLDALFELCTARLERGRMLYLEGKYQQALAQLEPSRRTAQTKVEPQPISESWQSLYADLCEWSGEAHQKLGEVDEALGLLQATLRSRKELSGAHSTDVIRRHKLMRSCVKLASAFRSNNDPDSSKIMELYKRAIDIGVYLVGADPTVTIWRRDLCSTYHRLGTFCLSLNELDLAMNYGQLTFEHAEWLKQEQPENLEWDDFVASSYFLQGRVYSERREWQEAYKYFQSSNEIREQSAAVDSENLTIGEELATTKNWLGWSAEHVNHSEEALRHYEDAVMLLQRLRDMQPNVPKRAIDVQVLNLKIAAWYLKRGGKENLSKAESLLTQTRSELQDLFLRGKLNGQDKKYVMCMKEIDKYLAMITVQRIIPMALSATEYIRQLFVFSGHRARSEDLPLAASNQACADQNASTVDGK